MNIRSCGSHAITPSGLAAGYLVWNTGGERPSDEGAPGTYVCCELGKVPRTGVRNYGLRVFANDARRVMDRTIEALRDSCDGPNARSA